MADENLGGYLVLSRNPDEKIMIGKKGDVLEGPIEIKILEVRGDRVRVACRAQENIAIDREEVYEEKLRDFNADTHKKSDPSAT